MDHAEATLDLNQVSVSWNNTSAHSCVRSTFVLLAEQASPRDYEPNEQLDDMTPKQFLRRCSCDSGMSFHLFSDRICRNHDSGECLIESNTQRSVAAKRTETQVLSKRGMELKGKLTSEFQAAAYLPVSYTNFPRISSEGTARGR